MIRGTTPKLEFVLPFKADSLIDGYVVLAQRDVVLVEKKISECQRNDHILCVTLSQEDTLKLDDRHRTEIQIRAKTLEGEVIASDVHSVETGRILKDGVI